MKKVLLAFAVAIIFVACGESSDSSTTTTDSTTTGTGTTTIGSDTITTGTGITNDTGRTGIGTSGNADTGIIR